MANFSDTKLKWLMVVLMVTIVFACAKPYYGYTRQEWDGMSDTYKSKIQAEYQQVLDAKNSQKHKDLIEEHRQKTIDFGFEMQ